jgi:hypothetical protein
MKKVANDTQNVDCINSAPMSEIIHAKFNTILILGKLTIGNFSIAPSEQPSHNPEHLIITLRITGYPSAN